MQCPPCQFLVIGLQAAPRPMSSMTGMEDGMKHRIHGKEVEQPYIIIFLT